MARGYLNTSFGVSLESVGLSLIPYPPTFAQGIALATLGINLQILGENEVAFGAIALTTGLEGQIISDIADSTNSNANKTIKEATKELKLNSQTIQEANSNLGTKATTQQNYDTQANTEPNNPQETDQNPQTRTTADNTTADNTTGDNTDGRSCRILECVHGRWHCSVGDDTAQPITREAIYG